jgi:hypothetical protein
MKNMRLLNRVVDRIQKGDDWDQEAWAKPTDVDLDDLPRADEVSMALPGTWARHTVRVMDPNVCGTAFCVAGHAVNMTHQALFLIEPNRDMADNFFDMKTGEVFGVEHRAAEILGLDEDEAMRLFDSDNTLDEILELVDDWADEEVPVRA